MVSPKQSEMDSKNRENGMRGGVPFLDLLVPLSSGVFEATFGLFIVDHGAPFCLPQLENLRCQKNWPDKKEEDW